MSTGGPDSDEVALAAIFDSVDLESRATSFRGGSLLCWFGGGTVDLRGATLDPAGARLTIRAIFGGGLLVVPDDWQVDLKVIGIMGGVGDSRDMRGTAGRRAAPHRRWLRALRRLRDLLPAARHPRLTATVSSRTS